MGGIVDDDTRVRLQRGVNDYINANLVQVPWANRNYILTQVHRLFPFLSSGLLKLSSRVPLRRHRIISGRWCGNRIAV